MTRGPSPPLLHLPPEGLDSEASSSRHTVGGQFAPPSHPDNSAPGNLPAHGGAAGRGDGCAARGLGPQALRHCAGTFFEALLAF